MILIRLSSTRLEALERYCHQVAERLQGIPAEVLGPGPAQVERVAGRYRWQILLKQLPNQAWDRSQLAAQIHTAIGHPPRDPRQLGCGSPADSLGAASRSRKPVDPQRS